MEYIRRGKVSSGRVILPAGLGKSLASRVVRQAQGRFARFIKPGKSVVDDLIRDRRAATNRE